MSQTPPPGQGPVQGPGQTQGYPSPQNYPAPQGQMGYGPPPGYGMPPGGGIPPGMYPMPRQSGGGGAGKIVVIVLLLLLLVGSVVFNVLLMAALAGEGAATAQRRGVIERVEISGNRKEKIAVVRLEGAIMEQSKNQFMNMLERVAGDNNIKALVIEIDSPGGAVTPSDEIYERIKQIKAEKQIPVIVSMSSLAASGGYYIACAGDQIFAQRTTLTGSIGVLFSRFDFSEMGEKYGVKDGTIVSDGATFKAAGGPLTPLTPEHEAYFKSILNDAFDTFKEVITEGRGDRLTKPLDQIANGKIYSADQALELGLVDQLGFLADAIAAAGTSAGLTNPHVVRFEREPTFFDILGGVQASSALGASANGGINVQVTPELIHEMTRPQLMYIWRGQ